MNGKQLKNSILQWAIQGKLVPQDPNDEPASVLLERIRQEKARLVKEGKIKKDKNESIIYRGDDNSHYEKFADGTVKCIDDEIPFEIPRSWIWVRLKYVCDYLHRGKSPSYGLEKKLPVIAQKCNQWDKIYTERCLFIDPKTISKYTEEQFVQVGDTIINSTGGGTVGRTGYVDDYLFSDYSRFVADSHITVVRGNNLLCKKYLYYFLISPFIQIGLEDRCSGSTNQIELGTETIRNYLLPLPPFFEQQRIVDMLGEVMPVADSFDKAQLKLDDLNNSVAGLLKKSILQEAIQGKLVPQCDTDEPAIKLLERIKEEKRKLVKAGKLKAKDIADSVIFKGEDNKYYQLINGSSVEIASDFEFPNSWEVVRLFDICRLTDGDRKQGCYVCLDAKYLRGKATGVILDKGKFVKKGENIILVDGENSGEVFTTPCDGYMGSTFKQLWVSKEMHLPYVLHFIQFYKDHLRNSKKGAAIPHLNKEVFYNLLIGIPPIKEQIRISNKIAETNGCLQIAK